MRNVQRNTKRDVYATPVQQNWIASLATFQIIPLSTSKELGEVFFEAGESKVLSSGVSETLAATRSHSAQAT